MPLAVLLDTLRDRAAARIALQWHRLDHEFDADSLGETEPACLLAKIIRVRSPMLRKTLKLSLGLAAFALIAGPALAQDCSKTTEGTAALADYPAVRAFYDAMTSGDASLVDCAVSAEWLNNPSAPGTPKGPEGFKPSVQGIRAVFSEYSFATQDVVATGDKVVVRSLVTAVQVQSFLGVAPGETPVTFQTIDIHQLGADGKLAQSWHVEDWMSFLFARGALPFKAE